MSKLFKKMHQTNTDIEKTISIDVEQLGQLTNNLDDEEYEYVTPHYYRNAFLVVLFAAIISATVTFFLVKDSVSVKIKEYYLSDGYVLTNNATATEDDIVEGKTAIARGSKLIGKYNDIDLSLATATANDIVKGYTAYSKDGLITGTIEAYSGPSILTPGTRDLVVKKGCYIGDNVNIIIQGSAQLDKENIVKDVTIFGVKGTLE